MPSAKYRPYHLGLNVPTHWPSRIINHTFHQYALRIFYEASLGWMPILVQTMAWCWQATSHRRGHRLSGSPSPPHHFDVHLKLLHANIPNSLTTVGVQTRTSGRSYNINLVCASISLLTDSWLNKSYQTTMELQIHDTQKFITYQLIEAV